jgi:O-antigen/teichoic acid export membrane protein
MDNNRSKIKKNSNIQKNKALGPMLLLIAQYATKIMGPLVSLFVVRYLGAEEYGIYASAIALISFLSFLPEFGIQQSILKLSVNPNIKLHNLIKTAFYISIFYSLLTFITLSIWLNLLNYDHSIKLISYYSGISFFKAVLLVITTSLLQVKLKFTRIAFWNLLLNSIQWLTTVFCILMNFNIYYLVFWPHFLTLIIALLMFVYECIKNEIYIFKRIKSKNNYRVFLKESLEFGTAVSMHSLYHRSDGAILSSSRNPIEVGYYAVAFKITELINFLPNVLFNQVLYPKYFYWSRNNRDRYLKYYLICNKVMLFLSIYCLCIILFFAKEIITVIFGSDEIISATILSVMIFSVPFRFLASSAGAIITTDNLIRKKIKVQSIIAIINIGANIILIPTYGVLAASTIMVITDLLLFIGYLYVTHKYVAKSHLKIKWFNYILFIVLIIFSFYLNVSSVAIKLLSSLIYCVIFMLMLFMSLKRHEKLEFKLLIRK